MACGNNKGLEILGRKLTPAWQGNGAIFVPGQRPGFLIHLCLYESQDFKMKFIFFMSLIGFRTLAEALQSQTKLEFPPKDFS